MSIDLNQLREFVIAIAHTNITELTLKSEDFELAVKKEIATTADKINGDTPVLPSPPQDLVVPPSPPAEASKSKWVAITSPMVGTFYRAPAPGEAPFVENNDHIRVGQTVCIIEAMKLMNEIESEVSGQVVEVSVENGDPVEYGQTLMWIEPD
ncbi:MAG: acetyl-CoA carboxylase biotin carboxyl carrier protein [Cyanophyceae cyanobacterium]